MKDEEVINRLTLIYTICRDFSWWEEEFTEAINAALEAIGNRELVRANAHIIISLTGGSR